MEQSQKSGAPSEEEVEELPQEKQKNDPGIDGNSSKLIVTLKGQAKSSQSSVAGIYTLEPKTINDKSHWLQNYVPSRGNTSSNAIWCKKNGIWAIGEIGRVGYIFSFDKLSSPEEATTWHYWNGSNFIASDDILVEAGSKTGKADPNLQDDRGETELHRASLHGHIEIVKQQLADGADPNFRNNQGNTALHKASAGGKLEVVKLLMAKGVDQNLRNNKGHTALHEACYRGHLEVVELLMENGADPNLTDAAGETALHQASFAGKLEVVKHLMANGADPNLRNNILGQTALHIASFAGKLEVVEFLIEKGADPKLKDNGGKTAYDRAKVGSGVSWLEKRCTNVMNYLQTLPQNGTQ